MRMTFMNVVGKSSRLVGFGFEGEDLSLRRRAAGAASRRCCFVEWDEAPM